MDKFYKRIQIIEETVRNIEHYVDFVNQEYDLIKQERRSDKTQIKI